MQKGPLYRYVLEIVKFRVIITDRVKNHNCKTELILIYSGPICYTLVVKKAVVGKMVCFCTYEVICGKTISKMTYMRRQGH